MRKTTTAETRKNINTQSCLLPFSTNRLFFLPVAVQPCHFTSILHRWPLPLSRSLCLAPSYSCSLLLPLSLTL
uniref:Uncharacterized protein n=1 Tax=Anguilla anguilla TaxID=7936 RepID=A0A0E9XB49_ANGAN